MSSRKGSFNGLRLNIDRGFRIAADVRLLYIVGGNLEAVFVLLGVFGFWK